MSLFLSFTKKRNFGQQLYPALIEGSVLIPDQDAINFINVAGITDNTQQSAITTLVYDLKVNGLWDKLSVIYPFVGGTADTHKYNLKNPADTDAAYRIVWSGGVTHASTGVTFNGTNGYGNTKYVQGINNDGSLSYYSRTSAANSSAFAIDMGAYNDTNTDLNGYALLIRRATSNACVFVANSGTTSRTASTTTTNGSGLFSGSIAASNSRKLYRNGSAIATNTTDSSQTSPTCPIFIGAVSNNSTPQLYAGSRECAFASIGKGLSDNDASNLYTLVQAYQTTLSRNV
jgi:hypothetical protein